MDSIAIEIVAMWFAIGASISTIISHVRTNRLQSELTILDRSLHVVSTAVEQTKIGQSSYIHIDTGGGDASIRQYYFNQGGSGQ